ncbi:MAG: hypothetical protein MJH09_11655 [Cetobacterium sp.]|uniref:Uncharacterized protein n=1 Tax=Cetobacterium ceti TaxID=180163 RepID=A0A1T4NIP3_9FUSO|nr:hypothetical protein [Cetobacterium ceti]MCJ8343480.1 hypothetical protein [Cetobacterium sp.]SJZ79170.1 hypothetical protein SAMN02745174_01548 [Cetobacterium ceti]
MELYLITEEEKKDFIEQYPVLKCENSIGILYDDYMSIKCKKITGTCTYRTSGKNDYLNCKILNSK